LQRFREKANNNFLNNIPFAFFNLHKKVQAQRKILDKSFLFFSNHLHTSFELSKKNHKNDISTWTTLLKVFFSTDPFGVEIKNVGVKE
jgi:hypothetical protein